MATVQGWLPSEEESSTFCHPRLPDIPEPNSFEGLEGSKMEGSQGGGNKYGRGQQFSAGF